MGNDDHSHGIDAPDHGHNPFSRTRTQNRLSSSSVECKFRYGTCSYGDCDRAYATTLYRNGVERDLCRTHTDGVLDALDPLVLAPYFRSGTPYVWCSDHGPVRVSTNPIVLTIRMVAHAIRHGLSSHTSRATGSVLVDVSEIISPRRD